MCFFLNGYGIHFDDTTMTLHKLDHTSPISHTMITLQTSYGRLYGQNVCWIFLFCPQPFIQHECQYGGVMANKTKKKIKSEDLLDHLCTA